jgi:alpha-L-rhamnosidase
MRRTVIAMSVAASAASCRGSAMGAQSGDKPVPVSWQAKWIWDNGAASPRNYYLLAVKDVEVPDTGGVWRGHVSGDSRYRFYVNGEWIGDGPARCFPFNQQFDTYDLTGLLRKGRNRLAILVSHYGEGTFQYNPSGQAGALVQVERLAEGEWQVWAATDGGWLVQRHRGFVRPTIRISCQMPFEEIFDARELSDECLIPGWNHGFSPAKAVAPVGGGPWKTMVPRSTPMLTRELVPPVRIFRSQLARTPSLFMGLTLRPYLIPGYFMQNHQDLKGFAATILESPADQTIRVFRTMDRYEPPIVNGQSTDGGKSIKLTKGDNLCLIVCRTSGHHEFDRGYAAFVDQPVRMKGIFNDRTPWTVFGPIQDYAKEHDKIARIKTAAELAAYKSFAKPVKEEHIVTAGSPWCETTFAEAAKGELRAENLEALCCTSPEVAVIRPSPGGDPEVFLDFGREVVGRLTFDVVAPPGVIMDFNCLEEIEEGKRIHYTYGNLSAMRYITREGRQQYTSFLRRGYRYCKLTLRNLSGPVRIRSLQTIFSTHPSVQRSSFACSDPLLNRIWEVGRHTLRCCSEDTFTDCPTYEQTYWVGDGRNEAMINYAAFGDVALTRRCAELPGESLFRQPITESQVPSSWDNLLTAWSLLWVQMAEEHYRFSGDLDYLKRVYPDVLTSLRNCREKLTDKRGLLSIDAWNMFDWAGQDSGHKVVTHNQMFLVEALRRAIFMARALGAEEDVAFLELYRKELIARINEHLWDEQKGAYIDSIHDDGKRSTVVSQQTNSLAVAYDVAAGDRLKQIQDVPVKSKEGMVKVGSPFALFYILEALAKQGRQAELLDVVRSRWGEMVDKGATTFWETFPGWEKDWWTRSYCHAWSAAPTYFLTRYQLGAWWETPGCEVVRIAPQPVDLKWARGDWSTPRGIVHVSWEKMDGKFELDVQLPAGARGVVELPGKADQYRNVTAESGQPKRQDDRWQMELAPGTHAKLKAEMVK